MPDVAVVPEVPDMPDVPVLPVLPERLDPVLDAPVPLMPVLPLLPVPLMPDVPLLPVAPDVLPRIVSAELPPALVPPEPLIVPLVPLVPLFMLPLPVPAVPLLVPLPVPVVVPLVEVDPLGCVVLLEPELVWATATPTPTINAVLAARVASVLSIRFIAVSTIAGTSRRSGGQSTILLGPRSSVSRATDPLEVEALPPGRPLRRAREWTVTCPTAAPTLRSLIVCASPTDTRTPIPDNALAVCRSITIDRPAGELHALWLTPDAQRQVMGHMADVTPVQDGSWHWKAHVPIFGDLEWDSRVVVNDPPTSIVWQSVDGAKLPNRGELEFRELKSGQGTELRLTWRFDPPAGALGDLLAKLSHAPQAATSVALRRFKSLAETGEVPSLTGNPAARDDPDPYGAFE